MLEAPKILFSTARTLLLRGLSSRAPVDLIPAAAARGDASLLLPRAATLPGATAHRNTCNAKLLPTAELEALCLRQASGDARTV